MKRKGFTLVELLVVIAIIALLVSILLPSLNQARELARRALCGANCNAIGKGIAMYHAESDDRWPWINTTNQWDVDTGTNWRQEPDPDIDNSGNRSITSLPFLLCTTGQPASLFICPSDSDATEMLETMFDSDDADLEVDTYYMDFAGIGGNSDKGTVDWDLTQRYISYSWQAPFSSSNGQIWSGNYEQAQIILADMTPAFQGNTLPDWSAKPKKNKQLEGMSQNHTRGKTIQMLYADGHVDKSNRADTGFSRDNIYGYGAGTPGPGGIVTSEAKIINWDDTYLIGPYPYAGFSTGG